MRYVLFLLFILSSGCVLNQPTNFYLEVHNSKVSNVTSASSTTKKETPAHKPKAVSIHSSVQPTIPKTCPEFVLPPKGPVPPTPVFSDPEIKAKVDIDVILTTHIKALKIYAANERKRVESAYRDWKETCR